MPNLKKTIAIFLFGLIKKHIVINGLTLDEATEKEVARRTKFWQKEKDDLAKALQEMHNQNSKHLNLWRDAQAKLDGQPNKKQLFDKYLQELIDSGSLIGQNLTEKQIQIQEHRKIIEDSGISPEQLKTLFSGNKK